MRGLSVIISLLLQVHKVIAGSLADRDGRIQKGDRVLSINGRSTKGITHREALSILKVSTPFHYIAKSSLCCLSRPPGPRLSSSSPVVAPSPRLTAATT